MANAMVALATTTISGTTSSVTFGSIPATYRDLRVVYYAGMQPDGNQDVGFQVNGGTGTSGYYMAGFGGGSTGSGGSTDLMGYVTSAGILNTLDILDYAQTDKHKPMLLRYGAAGNFAAAATFRWGSTSAITSLRFYLGTGNFSVGSTFSLYGIVS